MKYVGEIFKTKNCGNLLVTKYINYENVYVRFIDTGYETVARIDHIRGGSVRDKYLPSVYGVGILGDGVSKTKGKQTKECILWKNMLERCYSEKCQIKRPTYRGCTVSENFKYYTYFYEWCNKQVGFEHQGWNLDKDILVKGNKVYSEDTCCFVPPEINSLFTKADRIRGKYPIGVYYRKDTNKFVTQVNRNNIKGCQDYLGAYDCPNEAFLVYKEAKECHIKEVAEKWKDQIDPRVYEALMNYQVEITD